ncbi:Alpha/Beta hydrolase protein [Fennellomyces sp. T-0311]|nr:Alpha/Beta hydrolase protein [Fennellomyces sp. T-0311]
MRLTPKKTYDIPVHPSTEGYKELRLIVEKHEFPVVDQSFRRKIAFIWTHGSGFHKELLHPLMRRFIARLRSIYKYNDVHVDFIAWDKRNHGDSSRLNSGIQDETKPVSWMTAGLDLLQVIADAKQNTTYDKIIGIGHSSGACVTFLAEMISPKTFDGLCGIELIARDYIVDYATRESKSLSISALKRRDTWPSRDECREKLLRHAFWRKFHPEAMDNYVNYGLYTAEDGSVKLKCTKQQEHAHIWGDVYVALIVFQSLKALSIPAHLIFCTESTKDIIINGAPDDMAMQSPLITLGTVVGSHMLPAENPDLVVPEIEKLTERVCCTMHSPKLSKF